ncbi:hypothetical protein D3C76_1607470 [compost metagenome]
MREALEIDFEGRSYRVTYSVENGMINVSVNSDSRWATVGVTPPEVLAWIMGIELLADAKRRGVLNG